MFIFRQLGSIALGVKNKNPKKPPGILEPFQRYRKGSDSDGWIGEKVIGRY
jgi:hypothetical protein